MLKRRQNTKLQSGKRRRTELKEDDDKNKDKKQLIVSHIPAAEKKDKRIVKVKKIQQTDSEIDTIVVNCKRNYPPVFKTGDALKCRSFNKFKPGDLEKVLRFAVEDRKDFISRLPKYKYLESNIQAICLCQGGALHYVNGKNGVRDLDVYTFYSEGPYPFRRRAIRDFGKSQFGRYITYPEGYEGRVVDILGRVIPTPTDDYVKNIQSYLSKEGTATAHYLAEKAVVVLWPNMGRVIWNKKRCDYFTKVTDDGVKRIQNE